MKSDYNVQLCDFKHGDHACCIYDVDHEPWAFLRSFVLQGLERAERVLYVADLSDPGRVCDSLRSDRLEPTHHLGTGQLVLLAHDEMNAAPGALNPEEMIGVLRAETERAIAGNFTGLRIISDMTWAKKRIVDAGLLIEYEAQLHRFLITNPCTALCHYDRNQFDPTTLSGVLRTHPCVVIEQEPHNNVFYMAPSGLHADDLPTAQLHSWIEHLIEFKQKEQALRRNEERFRKVFEEGPIGMMMVDLRQRILRANPALCHMLDYSEPELEAMTVAEISHPDHRDASTQMFRRIVDGETPYDRIERRYLRHDGKFIWV